MTTTAILTQNTKLKRGQGTSPQTYTAVGQVHNFDGPGGKAAEIDITNFDSTAKEFQMGLKDEGTITFEILANTSDTQQNGLRTDRDNRTLQSFQLVLADTIATTAAFSAYVTEFKYQLQSDNVVKISVTLRISGPVTWSHS